jgi:16S rRNA (cytosine967-C5)-methyltransferase
MAISPARREAYGILLRVQRDGAWAGELLNAPRMDTLSREDRSLCHELVMRTLRWQSALDNAIAKYSSQQLSRLDAEVLIALRLAACQLLQLDRIPTHAAVHESVELVKHSGKRSAAPFANAVLRKLAANAKATRDVAGAVASNEYARDESAQRLAAEFAHPEWMAARWIDNYGYSAARAICAANQQMPQAALRLTAQTEEERTALEAELAEAGVLLAPGALLSSARRVIGGELAQTRAFREGRVAVQDEASQLVAALVGKGARILDCCAAPGGKTASIAARNPAAKIVAMELHGHRAKALQERLRALPVEVVCGDALNTEWAEPFDCVLADVPCSGTGTLAANPEIKGRLRAERLRELQDLQVSILRAAARTLAPGGRLVYSTCSLEPEEGEAVVEQVLCGSEALSVTGCESVLKDLKRSGELAWAEPRSLVRGDYLRTLPGVHPCEGFFAAVLRRDR